MTPDRERELIRAVAALRCKGEMEGFRNKLAEDGEVPTGPLNHALLERERGMK